MYGVLTPIQNLLHTLTMTLYYVECKHDKKEFNECENGFIVVQIS